MILFNKPNEFPRIIKAVNKFTSKQREDLDFVRMILNEDHLELIATDGYSVIVRNIPITMESKTSAIGKKLFISSSLIKSIPARIEGIKINNNTLEVYKLGDDLNYISLPLQSEGDFSVFERVLYPLENTLNNANVRFLDVKRLKKLVEGFPDVKNIKLVVNENELNPIALIDPDDEFGFAFLLPLRP